MPSAPRERFGFFPTPLHPLPRLSEHLGGPRLLVKRDDLTGFALGGNKVRKLEFFVGEAKATGADVLLTGGGHQSNHARITAAAAARAGLDCILVLSGGCPAAETGNLALDRLFGAEVRFVGMGPERMPALQALAEELRAAGRRPLLIPIGGSTPLGALGYVEAAPELAAQCAAQGVRPTALIHGSSSGGTQAGLVVGCRAAGLATRVIGVSADETEADLSRMVAGIAGPLAAGLGLPAPAAAAIEVLDAYVGDGYGIPTAPSEEATRLFARLEGIALDPTYGAKAAAGLIDLIRRKAFTAADTVCFWHTGGMTWHRPAGAAAGRAEEPKIGAATAELRREHELILRALTVLERAGRRLVSGHRVDARTLTQLVELLRALGDRCHHAKEEGFLFPAMRAKGIPREAPLGALLAQHGESRDYLAALSGHPSPAEQAAAALLYVQVMRDHIEKEDRVVFPVADALFGPTEQAALARRYAELEGRTFGPGFRERIVAELEALERAVRG